MDKKLILVTGGAGFIGSHLCKRLLKLNNKVLCLDNLFTGNKNNLLDIMYNEDFEFINHDITKSFFIKIESIKYIIFHVQLRQFIIS